MVHGAVPALAVVLPDEFPVRAHLVAPHRRDLGALEPLGPQVRAERLGRVLERCRILVETDEDQAADLAGVHAMQTEVAAVEVTVRIHSAAHHQLAVARVGPLMVGADDTGDMTGPGLADFHAAMATRVVKRVDPVVVAADDDEGVGVDVEDKIIARALDLTRVTSEEPAAAPDALELELVDPGVGLELALERVARRMPGDQPVEQRLSFGELGRSGGDRRHSMLLNRV